MNIIKLYFYFLIIAMAFQNIYASNTDDSVNELPYIISPKSRIQGAPYLANNSTELVIPNNQNSSYNRKLLDITNVKIHVPGGVRVLIPGVKYLHSGRKVKGGQEVTFEQEFKLLNADTPKELEHHSRYNWEKNVKRERLIHFKQDLIHDNCNGQNNTLSLSLNSKTHVEQRSSLFTTRVNIKHAIVLLRWQKCETID